MEFKILEENLSDALKTVERMRKIALKMGRVLNYDTTDCDPLVKTVYQPQAFSLHDDENYSTVAYPRKLITITVDGSDDMLTYDDARFIARIDVTDNAAIVLTAPDYEGTIPQHYYEQPENHCDHCEHRRSRVRYYLVEKDGELMQVGSTCVKEFIGINPNHMMKLFEHFRTMTTAGEYDDEFIGMGGSRHSLSLKVIGVARMAAGVVTVDKGYQKGETSITVDRLMFPPMGAMDEQWYKDMVKHYQDNNIRSIMDGFDFNAFTRFVEGMNPNNYTNNLKAVVKSEYVSQRAFAILVSGVYVYLKEMGVVGEKSTKTTTHLNEWVNASVGERITFNEVTVISAKDIETRFGITTLYRMLDNEGRTVVWFSSNRVDALEASYNDSKPVSNFIATIKKMDDYNGWKQTVVNRGKVN